MTVEEEFFLVERLPKKVTDKYGGLKTRVPLETARVPKNRGTAAARNARVLKKRQRGDGDGREGNRSPTGGRTDW